MTDLARIRHEVRRLRDEDVGKVGHSISYLKRLLASTELDDARADLTVELLAELVRYGREEEYTGTLRQNTLEEPDSPSAWIALAENLVFDRKLNEAIDVCRRAVQVAKAGRQLVRHALMTRARLERSMGEYHKLEATLRELLRDEFPSISADIDYEDDFLNDLPESAVDKKLIEQYRARLSR